MHSMDPRANAKTPLKEPQKGRKRVKDPKFFILDPIFEIKMHTSYSPSYIFLDKKTIFFYVLGFSDPFSRNFSKGSYHFCINYISGSAQDLEAKISIFTNLITQNSKIQVSRSRNDPLTLI